jgi:large subunit ribosomal protein L35
MRNPRTAATPATQRRLQPVASGSACPYNAARSRPAGHAVAAYMLQPRKNGSAPAAKARVVRCLVGSFEAGASGKESQMPKMKTKSGAKKRFRFTATGKVKAAAAGKRHGMIKRTAKFIQKARGTMVLSDSDAGIVKKYMPYNR